MFPARSVRQAGPREGFSLCGQTALVTGASRASGLGRAIATRLAREGASVAITYRSQVGQARETVALIEDARAKGIALKADLSDPHACRQLIADVVQSFGGIDIVVCNAGTRAISSFLELTESEWSADVAVNLSGVFHACQAAAREMVQADTAGRIVIISSCSASLAAPNSSSYTAAKGGVEALARAMAYELAKYQITVNCVAPGPAGPTDLNRDLTGSASLRRATEQSIPLGRLASSWDVAEAVQFLASPSAAYITGVSLGVDGGYTLGKDQTAQSEAV